VLSCLAQKQSAPPSPIQGARNVRRLNLVVHTTAAPGVGRASSGSARGWEHATDAAPLGIVRVARLCSSTERHGGRRTRSFGPPLGPADCCGASQVPVRNTKRTGFRRNVRTFCLLSALAGRLSPGERSSIDARPTEAMIQRLWPFWLREQFACARVPRLQHCKCFVKYGAQPNQPNPRGLASC
jgi:hypothetical protein